MSRLITVGFEQQSYTSEGMLVYNHTGAFTDSVSRGGSYSCRFNSLSSGTKKAVYFGHDGSAGDFYIRFYLRVDTAPSADNMIFFLGEGNLDFADRDISVKLSSGRQLGLYYNTSTQIGSSSSALTIGEWYRIEVRYNNSPSAGSEIAELKVDGESVASSSSLTLGTGIYTIAFGGNLIGESQTQGDWYFDDVAVNSSAGSYQTGYPGEGAVIVLRPNASGDNNTLQKTDGSAGDSNNYTLVDEIPLNTTDYVKTSSSPEVTGVDDYNVDNSGLTSEEITLVAVNAYVKCSNDDYYSYLRIKPSASGTVLEGSNITTTYGDWQINSVNQYYLKTPLLTSYVKPGTSNAWTPPDIDSMQIGLRHTAFGVEVQMSTIWAVVEYIPSPDTESGPVLNKAYPLPPSGRA